MNRLPTKTEVFSLPNAISAAGAGLVTSGVAEQSPSKKLILTGVGRTLDLIDGPVARATGQESDFGASVDSLLDKLASTTMVVDLWRNDYAPKALLSAVTAQNIYNASKTLQHSHDFPEDTLRPTTVGKAGLALQGAGFMAYYGAAAAEEKLPNRPQLRSALKIGGHVLTSVGLGLSMVAGAQYSARYRKRRREARITPFITPTRTLDA